MTHPMIAARLFGTPLLVDPAKGAAFLAGLGARITGGALSFRGLEDMPGERIKRASKIAERASILTDDVGARRKSQGRGFYTVKDGVAVIEVTGTLAHRGAHIGESSGVTSYEGLVSQVLAARDDPNVRGVALEIDSFGGEVAGVFDLADQIRDLRARKPVWAFVAEAALSAGYAIAAQADRIMLPRTGEVGSIGVLCIHADHSQMLEDQGVAVTLIHAGSHKVDGNPYEALPDEVRAEIQARVEETRDLFAETVAAGRGARLTTAAALATEAQVFRGKTAVAAGLADEVSELRQAFAGFQAHLKAPGGGHQSMAVQAAQTKGAQDMAGDNDKKPLASGEDAAVQSGAVVTSEAVGDPGAATGETTQSSETTAEATQARDTPPAAPRSTISTAEAAELMGLGQQAARLGVQIDVADAMRRGVSADALRKTILGQLSERGDEADIVVQVPAASAKPKGSPLVAAAKSAAQALTRA